MNPLWRIVIAALCAVISSSVVIAGEGGSALPEVANKVYLKECGSCHLAYQPQFLPKRSWEKIMNTLDKHFGDSATLDEATRAEILDYVLKNSAETSSSDMSRRILSSIRKDEAPLRISDTPYFKRQHDEVREDIFKRKSVGSPSNCGACHKSAEKGDYNEDKVKIPKK